MIDWCRTYKYDISRFNLSEFIEHNNYPTDIGWYLYEDHNNFSDHTQELRNELESLFDNTLSYMGVWDYFPGFVDDLGPHIDRGDVENAVVFMVPSGELTVTLHDPDTKDILESKSLSGNNIMILNHTKFMHDIQGVGELVVFGLAKEFDAEMFFRNDGKYYTRNTLDYNVEELRNEVMAMYPSDDKVMTFNYFPMSKGHTEYTWTFDPLPDYMKDIIERTTNEVLVPGITYLSDFRDTGTDLDIHKDPRWNSLGRVPPKLSMVCLDAYTKICFWTGRNGNRLMDYCLYGPGDVLTFDHTELFHSAKSILTQHRKINMQCYSYGDESIPFVVQYEDWMDKYGPWINEFFDESNLERLDLNREDMVTFMTFKDYHIVAVSTITIKGDCGIVMTYGNDCEYKIEAAHNDWAADNGLELI